MLSKTHEIYNREVLRIVTPLLILSRYNYNPPAIIYYKFLSLGFHATYILPPGVLAINNVQVSTPETSPTVDEIASHYSAARSGRRYSIPLGFPTLSFVQLHVPESPTAVDAINLYLWAVGLGGAYHIPLGSIILTTVQLYVPESSIAVDPLHL